MSKGVSILLSSKFPWKHQDSIIDQAGRYIFLKGLQVTLATVYAPNDHQDTFLKGILDKLLEFKEGQLIFGGDFNAPQHRTLPRAPHLSQQAPEKNS